MPGKHPEATANSERDSSKDDFVTLPAQNSGFTQKKNSLAGGERIDRERRGQLTVDRNRTIGIPPTTSRRRKRHEDPENHDRWLVSYADFITLLFALFVVMYAISSVNEGKYRVLSESMVAAFRSPAKSLEPIQVGQLAKSPVSDKIDRYQLLRPDISATNQGGYPNSAERKPDDDATQDLTGQEALDRIAKEIEESLTSFIDKDLITVRRDKLWLEVEIKTSILFSSGSTALEQQSLPILSELAEILKRFPNSIQVGGFTDDRPINSVAYPSNWELSAGRAAGVVHLFNKLGVKPERMAAVGYGEYRPMADNATSEGRNRNRRVVLQILARPEVRQAPDVGPRTAKTN